MVNSMREMKDSGIDFLDKIPSHWEEKPIRYLFKEITDKNKFGAEKTALKFTYGTIIPKTDFDADTDEYVANTILNYTLVTKGVIMINCLNLNFDFVSQRIGLVKDKGAITSAYLAIKPKGEILSEFANYELKYFDSIKAFHNMGTGVRKTLDFTELGKKYFAFPSILEQERIVSFLDAKCSEIDNLSADIQSEIDTLEAYKRSVITEAVTKGLDKNAEIIDSRIYYMAPYNSKWRLSKIGYECTKLWRPFNSEDTALLCTNKGKVAIRPDEMSGIMVSQDNAMQGIHKGDIAIHGMDTWHGAIALSDYDGKITRVVHVCDSPNDNRFIVYYLQQLAYNGVYKLISNGVRGNTSDFRSWDKVADIYIALPSLDEQSKISDYLDSVCVQVEDIIAQKQEQLEVLADYKKSVIYEYVTGKKEVPSV